MSESRLTRLEGAVFGWTGTNGLIGETKSHATRIREIEDTISTAKTAVTFVRWGMLCLGILIPLLNVEQIAAIMAAILKLAAK